MKKIVHIVLKNSERHFLAGSKTIGVANPHEYIELTLKLRGKKPLPDISEGFKNTLTHTAMAKEYGASEADIKTATDVFAGFGLDIIGKNAAAKSLYIGGSVKLMEEVFNVKLLSYSHQNGSYRGRIGFVHIPKQLESIVTGVFGLDSRKMITPKKTSTALTSITAAEAVHRAWYFPTELAAKYNFPKSDGAGQSIGILEFGGGYFEEDLKAFCKIVKVPVPAVIPISVDHTSTSQQDDTTREVMLDIEIVAAICPKATIPVYFGHFTERGWINILDKAIYDTVNKPSVLSVSYGLAEGLTVWTKSAMTHINEAFKQAALLGITICIASGDDGSDGRVGDGHAHVGFPASSPYVLAVGGTSLKVANGKVNETVWKVGDGLHKNQGGASGGGVSSVFPKPSWQNAIAIKSINPGAIEGRIVPDVAAYAESDGTTTGYFVVIGGQSIRNGGTSAAAPLWASLIGRINALLPAGKKTGYLTPLLYQPIQGSKKILGKVACKDITSGDNISASIGGYTALKGYDAATGWGSPDGTSLLNELKKIL